MRSPRLLPTALAALCGALPLAACSADEAPPAERPAAVPAEQQVRTVAKTVAQAYVAEDYDRLCAQFAPGTFKQVIELAGVDDCPALFAKAPSFSAPSPQQIDAAHTRIRGDRATIDFAERGVESMHLRNLDGRWYIANEAEIES